MLVFISVMDNSGKLCLLHLKLNTGQGPRKEEIKPHNEYILMVAYYSKVFLGDYHSFTKGGSE
jgi:hypothetical protein